MNGFQQFLQQIQQLWLKQTAIGKVVYAGALVATVAAVSGVGYWVTKVEYQVLCSGLPAEEAAAIVEKLDADRTEYKLASGGTTILVAADKVQKTRMTLAVAGLTKGPGKGFELFDEMSMGATPFVQNMNYVRAIQGELARTIMQLEPVAQARGSANARPMSSSPTGRPSAVNPAVTVIAGKPITGLSRRLLPGPVLSMTVRVRASGGIRTGG